MEVAECSFLQFVYPFTFSPETFDAREKALSGKMSGAQSVWVNQKFPQGDLMPHVAAYLNPNTAAKSASQGDAVVTPATARLWKLSDKLEQEYGLGRRADWTLVQSKHTVPFYLGGEKSGKDAVPVQLVLFRVGVGMLIVQANPKGENLAEWLDFLHYFRVSDGQRDLGLKGARRVGKDQTAPFFPESAGGVAAHPDGRGTLRDLLEALLRTGDIGAEEGDWWADVFVPGRLLPFAALYVDGLDGEAEAAALRYRLRHFFRADQEIVPCASDLCDDHSSVLTYADRQWFIFSIEGGAFLACDVPSGFFRETLPNHLREDYFLLFLLALHQRFALMDMSAQVARHWPLGGDRNEPRRQHAFTQIRDTLLAFTARGYFAQVMQRDNHHRVYRKWQDVFQLERLYGEVRDEVREMHEYLRMEQAKRAEELQEAQKRQTRYTQQLQEEQNRQQEKQNKLISRFSIVIGLIASLFAFLSVHIKGFNDSGVSARFALGSVLITTALGLFLVFGLDYLKSRRAKGNHRVSPTAPRMEAPRTDPDPPLPPPAVAISAAKVPGYGVKAGDEEEAQVARLKAGGD